MALLPNVVLAATLFCGLFIWSPILQGRQRRAEQEREQAVKQADLQQQRDAQNAAVLNAIAQHGLMAFTEPMSDTEEWNLEYYIRSAHKFTPAELTEAAEYYQNPKIMMALAQNLGSPVTWNLTFFRLCHYVLKHKLPEFNAEYPKRYRGLHKKAKAPTIVAYDDFASDLKESEVIDICRSANIITKEQFNALDRQIGRRNSAAHPSTTVITVLPAEEFIHDLVTNVVVTIPL